MGHTEWFQRQIGRCVERELSQRSIRDQDPTNMSEDELVEVVRANVRCYYQVLAAMGENRFGKILNEMFEPVIRSGKEVDSTLFRYLSKFTDPREIMRQQEVVAKLNKAALDEMALSIDGEDSRLMGRLWSLSYLNELRFTTMIASIRPLLDVLAAAEATCQLDINWAVSLISLVLEEAMVKRRLRELGETPSEKDQFHTLSEKLRKLLEAQGLQASHDLLLVDGFRNVRHKVAHDPEAWHPTPEQTHEHVRHAIELAKFLWPSSSSTDYRRDRTVACVMTLITHCGYRCLAAIVVDASPCRREVRYWAIA